MGANTKRQDVALFAERITPRRTVFTPGASAIGSGIFMIKA